MTETKFTPGPWCIYPETDGTEICAVDNIKSLPIRQRIAHPIRGANWTANARLIAAAPDMYEALYNATSLLSAYISDRDDIGVLAVDLARAALAKARGEA